MEIKLKTPKGVFFSSRGKPRNFITWKGWHLTKKENVLIFVLFFHFDILTQHIYIILVTESYMAVSGTIREIERWKDNS